MERDDMTAMEGTQAIRVADVAPAPGGRFVSDGPFSGEWFREDILRPALEAALRGGYTVKVELDGTAGYGSSFLEEAFGGLIRESKFRPDVLERHLDVTAKSKLFLPYRGLVERYIKDAARAKSVA